MEQGLSATSSVSKAAGCLKYSVLSSVPAENPPSPYELYIGMQEHLYPFLQCVALLFHCTTGIQFIHSSGDEELRKTVVAHNAITLSCIKEHFKSVGGRSTTFCFQGTYETVPLAKCTLRLSCIAALLLSVLPDTIERIGCVHFYSNSRIKLWRSL